MITLNFFLKFDNFYVCEAWQLLCFWNMTICMCQQHVLEIKFYIYKTYSFVSFKYHFNDYEKYWKVQKYWYTNINKSWNLKIKAFLNVNKSYNILTFWMSSKVFTCKSSSYVLELEYFIWISTCKIWKSRSISKQSNSKANPLNIYYKIARSFVHGICFEWPARSCVYFQFENCFTEEN